MPDEAARVDDRVALPLTLAATNARVDVVHLTSVGPPFDLAPLTDQLGAGAPTLTVDTLVAPFDPPAPPASDREPGGEGLVVIAPEVHPRSELRDVEHLLAVSQWPLVGVITYPSPIWRRHPGPGPVRSRLLRVRTAIASMIGRHRRAANHAGPSAEAKRSPLVPFRLRRLLRASWGAETES